MEDVAYREAMDRAMGLLASRARSSEEVRRKLIGDFEEVLPQVMARLEELGLIDDVTFARDWADRALSRDGIARDAIAAQLEAKGVSRDVVDAVVETMPEERDSALDLARSRFRRYANLAPDVARRRLAGVLARKGFDFETIRGVVDEVLEEAALQG